MLHNVVHLGVGLWGLTLANSTVRSGVPWGLPEECHLLWSLAVCADYRSLTPPRAHPYFFWM